jgi:hypothetical protein
LLRAGVDEFLPLSVQVAAQETVTDAKKELILPKYCESVYRSKRRPTRTVKVWSRRMCGPYIFMPLGWLTGAVGLMLDTR